MGWQFRFRRDDKIRIVQILLVVAQRLPAPGIRDAAARSFGHCLPGCRVPLHGGREARVNVSFALCHKADFQRTARRAQLYVAVLATHTRHELLCFLAEVRARSHHHECAAAHPVCSTVFQGQFFATHGFKIFVKRFAECLALIGADDARIQLAACRHIDCAHYGAALVAERDVDGKLAVAFQKLLRAVQRVHDPHRFHVFALCVFGVPPLFAQYVERRFAQIAADYGMCLAVGQCQGRIVRLALHLPVGFGAFIYFHDGLSCLDGGLGCQVGVCFQLR